MVNKLIVTINYTKIIIMQKESQFLYHLIWVHSLRNPSRQLIDSLVQIWLPNNRIAMSKIQFKRHTKRPINKPVLKNKRKIIKSYLWVVRRNNLSYDFKIVTMSNQQRNVKLMEYMYFPIMLTGIQQLKQKEPT